jgi:hypothetical protein
MLFVLYLPVKMYKNKKRYMNAYTGTDDNF